MEKLIKKSSKNVIRKIKSGHINNKNVLLKNNEKNRKQISKKLCKNYINFLKIYIKKGKNNDINSENLCKNN